MRKPLIYSFRPPTLASKINQQIMLFPTRFLDLSFLICFQSFLKMVDLGTPSKSNRVQNDTKNPPSGATTPQIEITWRPQNEFLKQPCARDAIWSALGPFFHDEEFGILSDPMLNNFQCILASLLVLNSGIRWKRQTPETMQHTCRELARNF